MRRFGGVGCAGARVGGGRRRVRRGGARLAVALEAEASAGVAPPGAAAWRLRVDDPKGARLAERALEGRRYLLGRGKHCDVCLPAREVSREHAALECDEAGRWWLVDLGSTSGTFVNGRRLEGRRALSAFDVAYVGEYRLELRSDEPPPRPSLVLPAGRAARTPARVRVYEGRLAGRDLRLDRGCVAFGEGADVALEGEAYAGVRVVIRPLKEGDYEVVDESERPGLTVDGRPARAHRLGSGDVLLGLGPVERQRANALDAFSVRYLPAEHVRGDDTPGEGPLAGDTPARVAALFDDETDEDTPAWPADAPADRAPAGAPVAAARGRGERPAARGDRAPAAGAGRAEGGPPGHWPDIDFGERAGAVAMAQTVELKRPARLEAPGEAPSAPEVTSSSKPDAPAPAPTPSGRGPQYMGETMARPPAAERVTPDAAPVSLSAFVRPLAATLSSPPDSPAPHEPEEAYGVAAFGPEVLVNRTLKLSEPAWPAQREALRARAEAAPRRWWPGAALVLALLTALALLAGVRRRVPARPEPLGGAPSSVRPSPPPKAAATAPAPSAPALAASADEGDAAPAISARPARAPRGADGASPRGDDVEPERRRRLQELCKQRGDCSP